MSRNKVNGEITVLHISHFNFWKEDKYSELDHGIDFQSFFYS